MLKSELRRAHAVSRSQEVATAMGAIQADMTKQNSNEGRVLMQLARERRLDAHRTPLHAIRAPAAESHRAAAADSRQRGTRPSTWPTARARQQPQQLLKHRPSPIGIATGAEPLVALGPRSSASSSEMLSVRRQSPSNAVTSAAPSRSARGSVTPAATLERRWTTWRRWATRLVLAGWQGARRDDAAAAHHCLHAHARSRTPSHAFVRLDAEASTRHMARRRSTRSTPRRSVQALQAAQPNIVLNLAPAAAAHSPRQVHLPERAARSSGVRHRGSRWLVRPVSSVARDGAVVQASRAACTISDVRKSARPRWVRSASGRRRRHAGAMMAFFTTLSGSRLFLNRWAQYMRTHTPWTCMNNRKVRCEFTVQLQAWIVVGEWHIMSGHWT